MQNHWYDPLKGIHIKQGFMIFALCMSVSVFPKWLSTVGDGES